MTVIETDRLKLRQPGPQDVDALIDFYKSERSAMAGGNVSHFEAVLRAYAMLGHWRHRGFGLFSVTVRGNDTAIGLVGPYFPPGRPEREIGWMLFEGAEGKGYATEAASAAVDYAFNDLGWTNMVHYIAPENLKSVKLAKRIGAVLDPDAQQPKPGSQCYVFRQTRRVLLQDAEP